MKNLYQLAVPATRQDFDRIVSSLATAFKIDLNDAEVSEDSQGRMILSLVQKGVSFRVEGQISQGFATFRKDDVKIQVKERKDDVEVVLMVVSDQDGVLCKLIRTENKTLCDLDFCNGLGTNEQRAKLLPFLEYL